MKTEVNDLLIEALAGHAGTANKASFVPPETLVDACMDCALNAVAQGFREAMDRIMKGALVANQQEVHLEWLADAEQLVVQFLAVVGWIARQREVASPQLTQS